MSDSAQISESEHDVDCCPICLRSIAEASRSDTNHADQTSSEQGRVEFVYSRMCGHMFCLACIQKLLLSPSLSKRTTGGEVYLPHDDAASAVGAVITTTQGICPMCRADISYFELFSCYCEGGSIMKTNNSLVVSDPLPDGLLNCAFATEENSLSGSAKISFPSTFERNGEPIIIEIFSQMSVSLMQFYYLSATHTLFFMGNGTVLGNDEIGVRAWSTFSDNFEFITHGVICFTDKLQSSAGVNTTPADRCLKAVFQFAPVRNNNSMVRRRSSNSISNVGIPSAPCYNKLSLWGNVFCQQFKVGMASYHFWPGGPGNDDSLSAGEAYISYEHEFTAGWPPLDNGRPIPSRVKFHNIICPDRHTFRASICWLQDYNTTWQGASRWDYEMKFDTAYMCIKSGTVHSVAIHEGNRMDTTNETSVRMSSYGRELNYINAGLFDEFRKSHTKDVPDSVEANARSESRAVIDRLMGEGAPGSVLVDIIHVRDTAAMVDQGEQCNGINPIDLRYYYS